MEIKRKMYKHIAIISFSIVLILIVNLMLPIFINAEEKNNKSITMNYEIDKLARLIKLTGTIPTGFTKYELYWANKEFKKDKPTNNNEVSEFVTNTIEWYKSDENKLLPVITVEGKTDINTSYVYTDGNSYSVLCLVYNEENIAMMSWANYASTSNEEKSASKESDISLELYRITDSNYGDLAIKATSKRGKIAAIKYQLSDSPIDLENTENKNNVKNSGTSMKVTGNNSVEEIVKSDGEFSDEKYIVLYVQSMVGDNKYEYWENPGKISSINKVENAPWENVDLDKLESENNSSESNKQDTSKINETKIDTTKIDATKTDTTKTDTTKTDTTKTNTTKTDTTKTNTTKTDDIKTSTNVAKQQTAKYEEKNQGTYETGNPKKNVLPQTGKNDSFVIFGIILFSIIGLTSFIKYKKEK